MTREEGHFLTRIEPGTCAIERRAYRSDSDGYVTIVTWQSSAGETRWFDVDHWEMSPSLVENLLPFLTARKGEDGVTALVMRP